jgi:hypothetical protein
MESSVSAIPNLVRGSSCLPCHNGHFPFPHVFAWFIEDAPNIREGDIPPQLLEVELDSTRDKMAKDHNKSS